jgi:hypothetical protein
MTVEELEQARVFMNERKTAELCNHQHAGHRCVLDTGHHGEHESLPWRDQEPLRWR